MRAPGTPAGFSDGGRGGGGGGGVGPVGAGGGGSRDRSGYRKREGQKGQIDKDKRAREAERERKRGRERQRDRQTDRGRETDRKAEREAERERQRERPRGRDRQRESVQCFLQLLAPEGRSRGVLHAGSLLTLTALQGVCSPAFMWAVITNSRLSYCVAQCVCVCVCV